MMGGKVQLYVIAWRTRITCVPTAAVGNTLSVKLVEEAYAEHSFPNIGVTISDASKEPLSS
jgi:hypothetical protein